MKNIVFFLIVFLANSYTAFSQELVKVDYTYTDKNDAVYKSTLLTDNKESTFKIHDDREGGYIDLPNGNTDFVSNDLLSKIFYSNDKSSYYRFPMYGIEMVYKDDYSKTVKWEINENINKKIGKYNCRKAKITIGGRNFTAWFTFDIPIKFGPLKFQGLPGLIVEVTEDKGYLSVKLDALTKTKDLTEFKTCKNYFLNQKHIIDYPEYEKKIISFEVSRRIRMIAKNKELNAAENTNGKIHFDNNKTLDTYLEIPKMLLEELNKIQD